MILTYHTNNYVITCVLLAIGYICLHYIFSIRYETDNDIHTTSEIRHNYETFIPPTGPDRKKKKNCYNIVLQ